MNDKISKTIEGYFFNLKAMSAYGFFLIPSDEGHFGISVPDLQKYLKAINDKIIELESNPQ